MVKTVIILGLATVLLSPAVGSIYASFLLTLSGGMESDKYYILIDGCISAIRVLGIIVSAWGIAQSLRDKT